MSNGVAAANKFIQEAAEAAGKRVARHIATSPVTKELWYQLLKKLTEFFGKKFTKEGAEQMAKKVIPVFGAVVSGAFTLTTFSVENERLKRKQKGRTGVLGFSE